MAQQQQVVVSRMQNVTLAAGGGRPAITDVVEAENPELGGDQPAEPAKFESLEDLNKEDTITEKNSIDQGDVEVLIGQSGHTYLISKKGRSLNKHILISGLGAGRYVPQDSPDHGLRVDLENDKSILQCDMSGVDPNNSAIDTLSLYRYLLLLERMKKVTKYNFTYMEVARKSGDNAVDGFTVAVTKQMKYRSELSEKKVPPMTGKNYFPNIWPCVRENAAIQIPCTSFQVQVRTHLGHQQARQAIRLAEASIDPGAKQACQHYEAGLKVVGR